MPEIKDLICEVLQKGYLMSLATVDDGGVWVADVIYVFDENLNLYWMSKDSTRHSKAISLNPGVAGTVTVSGQGEHNLGIQFSGTAEKLEETRFDLGKKHFEKRGKPIPQETDDILHGSFWYCLKPQKIELIYEPLFGFKKQVLEL
jgi:uncharacterized protein YhbP (UPF0306 family)